MTTAPVADSTDRQIAILQVEDQRCPAPQAILDRFRRGGAVRDLTALARRAIA